MPRVLLGGRSHVTKVGHSFSFKNITFLFLDEEPDVDMSSCATSGGTADGAPCSFPFEYGGVTYLNCTSAGHTQVSSSLIKKHIPTLFLTIRTGATRTTESGVTATATAKEGFPDASRPM